MKSIKKKKRKKRKSLWRKYSNKKNKLRNFFKNLSYQKLNKNESFEYLICDWLLLILYQSLNPILLEGKFPSQTDQQHICMLWEKCIPNEFYRLVCQNSNIENLFESVECKYCKVDKIVSEFVSARDCNTFIWYFDSFVGAFFQNLSCRIKSMV